MKAGELQVHKNVPDTKKIDQTRPADKSTETKKIGESDKSFAEVLNDRIDGEHSIEFSAHAIRRMNQRNIQMNAEKFARLTKGVAKIEDKGGKNSVVLMDDEAYVVSVKNKKVITAMPGEKTKNNVFTNIDSMTIV